MLLGWVRKVVDSAKLTCQEPVRSTDLGRDIQVCGGQSLTYCDNDDCQQQLCQKHVQHCDACGQDFCISCMENHRC